MTGNAKPPRRIVLAMGTGGVRIWSGDKLPASFAGEPQHTYWLAEAGRFSDYSTDDLAAQCRMQARENLDPEYSQFMHAVADRLEAAQGMSAGTAETAAQSQGEARQPGGEAMRPEGGVA